MSSKTTPMDSSLIPQAIRDTTQHEINTLLERPVFTPPVTWANTSPVLSFNYTLAQFDARTVNYLVQYDFPQTIFENSQITVDKLKNFQYMKADLEIELKINPNPNLRGALLMVYKPYNGNMLPFRRFANSFMASQTTFPHKILNMEETTSVKMIVPYTNIYDHFDLDNLDNQFGTVTIYVLAPLVGTESAATTQIALNCRFIKPDYRVPTNRDVLTTYQNRFILETLKKRPIPGVAFAESDSAPLAAPDTGEVVATGPISKVSAGVAMVSDVLSNVPAIGKIASSVNWVARMVNRTAAVFGLSKPVSIQPQCTMVVKPNHNMVHTEGKSDSTTLALLNDNGIDGSTFIPETKDEMSFKYILSQPNIFHAFRTSVEQFSDRKLLSAWEVSPFSQYSYTFEGEGDTLYMGSFGYTCANFATLWTGTINFDIHMIKTCFHRGRFVIAFLPETNLADVPTTLGEITTQTYNAIVNLQDRQDELGRTVIRFSVPYTANTPWRETFKLTNNTPDATTLETKTGCVAMYSLTDLSVNPTIADPNMDFYIAHSAGEDFQLGRPVLNLAPGYNGAYAQADHGRVYIPEDENIVVPSHEHHEVSAGTTGEYYTGLRQLMKRAGWLCDLSPQPNYLGIKTRTFREQSGLNATGTRNLSSPELPLVGFPTPYYMASFLYTFHNGSTNYHIIPKNATAMLESYLRFDDVSDVTAELPVNDSIGQPIFQQLQRVSNAYEIRTPWYRAIRGDVNSSSQTAVLNDVRTCIRLEDEEGANARIYESAGDDFNFYFMRGPPPMVSIKQVNPSTIPVLPATGTSYTINTTNTVVIASGTTIQFASSLTAYTPTPDVATNKIYNIISDQSYTVTFEDGTTQNYPANELLLQSLDGVALLTAQLDTGGRVIDTAATQATVQGYGSVTFISAFPVASSS